MATAPPTGPDVNFKDVLVLFPKDAQYTERQQSYWAANTRLAPACIVLPETAKLVASLLTQLQKSQRRFAVRGGGHSPVPGTADVAADGVTVDLSRLNTVVVDAAAGVVRFGAGARWRDVYAELTKFDLTVAGGRGGDCDNVVSFEIVLAGGRVVTASPEENADLFRALKGGGNNFGIITSFTMKTLPSSQVWGGIAATPQDDIPQVVDMQWKFTEEAAQYPDSYIMTVIGYFPDFGTNVVSTCVFQADGVQDAPAFELWRKLPKIVDMTNVTTVYELSHSIALPANYHNAWFSLTLKNDQRIMTKATEVHQALVDELKQHVPDGNFMTQCIFQPLPTAVAERSVEAGGNVLGLERNADAGNVILFQYAAMMPTADLAAWVHPKLAAGLAEIRDFAAGVNGGLMEFVYMNYADRSQDVLRGFGGKNVEFLRRVAAKYDPDQVFQKLCPGGWKISDVEVVIW